ncbi:initiation control protein YabA [Peptococcaceae bacterium 1198_IL3148]
MKKVGPLPGRIARLEYMVKELLAELDDIKKIARSLEEENDKLRRQLTAVINQPPTNNKKELSSKPDEPTLLRLYNEGFHICNVRFAQGREDECLFCLSLLRRQDGEVTDQ